jgi:hypothetical protein
LNVSIQLSRRLECQGQCRIRRQKAERRFTAPATIHDLSEARQPGPGEKFGNRVTTVVLCVVSHGLDERPNIHGELGRCLVEPLVQPPFCR